MIVNKSLSSQMWSDCIQIRTVVSGTRFMSALTTIMRQSAESTQTHCVADAPINMNYVHQIQSAYYCRGCSTDINDWNIPAWGSQGLFHRYTKIIVLESSVVVPYTTTNGTTPRMRGYSSDSLVLHFSIWSNVLFYCTKILGRFSS